MSRPVVSRPAARLSAFYAAAFLVTGVQLPFWPVWLASRGLGPEEIGMVLAAALWAKVAASPAIGALADRLGCRPVMAGLGAASVAGYALMVPARGFWPLLLLNLAALTAQSALMPLGDAATLAMSRAGGLAYGRIRAWGSLSFVLSSLAAGAVLGQLSGGWTLALVLGASSLLFAACCAIPSTPDPRRGSAAIPLARRGGLRLVIADPRFWVFVASAGALQASHQLYYGFGTLYWRSLGFSPTTIGWLWAEGVVAELLLFWQGRRLLAFFGPLGLMAAGGVGGIARWGFAGFAVSLPAFAALQLLHALTFGATYLGSMHYLSLSVPRGGAAGAQALFAAASSGIGGGLAMAAIGALYANYGGHAYWAMAVLSALGLAGTIRLGQSPSRG